MGSDCLRQLLEKIIEEPQVYIEVTETGTRRLYFSVMPSDGRNLNWCTYSN